MKMKEIEVSPFIKTKNNFSGTDPYTIAFVYSPDGNCVVKGMSKTVEDFINTNFPRCIYYITYWNNGECRGFWSSPLSMYIERKKQSNGKYRFVVSMQTMNGFERNVFSFRRVPRKWLHTYDRAILVI